MLPPCFRQKSVEALPYMELSHFILEGCRGSTVTRNVGIYRKITIAAICSGIRTELTLKKKWNVLRKDTVHIVTTVLSSSVSCVHICDSCWTWILLCVDITLSYVTLSYITLRYVTLSNVTLRKRSFLVIAATKIVADVTLVQCSHFEVCWMLTVS